MKEFKTHAYAREFRYAEKLALYDRASDKLIVTKVAPWTPEQLAEARQRCQQDVVYNAYARRQATEEYYMAQQFADHATIRGGSDIKADAVLEVAMAVIEARQNGRSVGITGFTRNDEWTAKDQGESGAKSAQRALVRFLEANGFTVASTTKHLSADVAPIELLAYNPVLPVAEPAE